MGLLGFRVWVFRVWGFWALGFGVLGFRASSLGLLGLGFGVLGLRVWGFWDVGFGSLGFGAFGLRVWGFWRGLSSSRKSTERKVSWRATGSPLGEHWDCVLLGL